MTFFGNIKVFNHDVLFHRLTYLRAERNPLEVYGGRRRPFIRSCRHYFQIAAVSDPIRTRGHTIAASPTRREGTKGQTALRRHFVTAFFRGHSGEQRVTP